MSSFAKNTVLSLLVAGSLIVPAFGQEPEQPPQQPQYSTAKERIKYVRAVAKQANTGAIGLIAPYLKDPDTDVRIEATKGIVSIGGQPSLDPLLQALSDNSPEVQSRATAGLVNFYFPGYLPTGITGSVKRAKGAIVSQFSSDRNNQIIPDFVDVRPDIIQGLGRVVSGGASMEARADAARAVGILRGRAALPELEAALRAKDTNLIYESLIAIQKIHDPSAGPAAQFLLRDIVDRVQMEALETAGLLRNQAALPDIRAVYQRPRNSKVRRTALNAIAYMPDAQDRETFVQALSDKDPGIRAAAAEGLGWLGDPADRQTVMTAFDAEPKPEPRMALAFAAVLLGDRDMTEFAPLRYLVNQLNSASSRGTTLAYLRELARQQEARAALYPDLDSGTKDEKTGLAQVFAVSGDNASLPYLDKLSHDQDSDVAREGLAALRSLKTRLGQ